MLPFLSTNKEITIKSSHLPGKPAHRRPMDHHLRPEEIVKIRHFLTRLLRRICEQLECLQRNVFFIYASDVLQDSFSVFSSSADQQPACGLRQEAVMEQDICSVVVSFYSMCFSLLILHITLVCNKQFMFFVIYWFQ